MPSQALRKWLTDRTTTLDDLENAHRSVRGAGSGARAAIQQINQAYAVLLSAQFQGFCRELHTQCADLLVGPLPNVDHPIAMRINLLFGRKLDRGNPNHRLARSFDDVMETVRPVFTESSMMTREVSTPRSCKDLRQRSPQGSRPTLPA